MVVGMRVIAKTPIGTIADHNSGIRPAIVAAKAVTPKEIYLHPGQMYVGSEPATVSMILGSCVGVCLYDKGHEIGGATHYMLPKWEGAGAASPRYGDVAIHSLVSSFESRGSKRHDLQAMVFGGASILRGFRQQSGQQIGARNIEVAIELLEQYGIFIVTKSIAGEHGRKVKMRTDIGTVTVKLIGNS